MVVTKVIGQIAPLCVFLHNTHSWEDPQDTNKIRKKFLVIHSALLISIF